MGEFFTVDSDLFSCWKAVGQVDIFRLKDESLEASDNLLDPDRRNAECGIPVTRDRAPCGIEFRRIKNSDVDAAPGQIREIMEKRDDEDHGCL